MNGHKEERGMAMLLYLKSLLEYGSISLDLPRWGSACSVHRANDSVCV